MDKYFYPSVSEETFAAWLDGTLSAEDERHFLEMSANSTEIQELLDANDQVDESFEGMIENGYELPEEFNTDFELPEIYDDSTDIEEYEYDEVEPYDVNDDDCEDSDVNDDELSYHETSDIGDNYEQDDYDII